MIHICLPTGKPLAMLTEVNFSSIEQNPYTFKYKIGNITIQTTSSGRPDYTFASGFTYRGWVEDIQSLIVDEEDDDETDDEDEDEDETEREDEGEAKPKVNTGHPIHDDAKPQLSAEHNKEWRGS